MRRSLAMIACFLLLGLPLHPGLVVAHWVAHFGGRLDRCCCRCCSCCCCQVGRAKEKAAESDKKKKRAVEKFEAFVRSAEGLYSNTTWEEFEDAFKKEDEFIAVSCGLAAVAGYMYPCCCLPDMPVLGCPVSGVV